VWSLIQDKLLSLSWKNDIGPAFSLIGIAVAAILVFWSTNRYFARGKHEHLGYHLSHKTIFSKLWAAPDVVKLVLGATELPILYRSYFFLWNLGTNTVAGVKSGVSFSIEPFSQNAVVSCGILNQDDDRSGSAVLVGQKDVTVTFARLCPQTGVIVYIDHCSDISQIRVRVSDPAFRIAELHRPDSPVYVNLALYWLASCVALVFVSAVMTFGIVVRVLDGYAGTVGAYVSAIVMSGVVCALLRMLSPRKLSLGHSRRDTYFLYADLNPAPPL
jgi:hypothetical protein